MEGEDWYEGVELEKTPGEATKLQDSLAALSYSKIQLGSWETALR